jgi:hypothetical protein
MLCAALVITVQTSASAAVYYVSSSLGNDSWSGTQPNPNAGGTDGPKQSLTALRDLVEAARPGDQVLLRRGDSFVGGGITVDRGTGTQASPIVVGAYGTGNIPRWRVSGTSPATAIFFGGTAQWQTWQDLEITASVPSTGVTTAIMTDSNAGNLRLLRLNIHHIGGWALSVYASNVTVEACTITDNYATPTQPPTTSSGIFTGPNVSSFQLLDSTVSRNGCPDWGFCHSIYINGTGHRIAGNHFDGSPTNGRHWTSGLKIRGVSNTTISGNTIVGFRDEAISIGSDLDSDSANNTIENNVIANSKTAIWLGSQNGMTRAYGTIVRNNILHSSAPSAYGSGYLFISDSTVENFTGTNEAYNNTIYGVVGAGHAPIAILSGSWIVKNNILHRSDNADVLMRKNTAAENSSISDYNLFDRSDCSACNAVRVTSSPDYPGLANYQAASAHEDNGVEGAADLVSPPVDFHLTAGSLAAIDQGASMNSSPANADFEGQIRPQGNAWDIGAYEFSDSAVAPPAAPLLLD